MSGRPGKLSSRRSSEEIVYAILNYLEQNENSVRLNDIAVEIGSNTKLVQRWLKIIKDIQLKPNITFEDKRGPKIRLLHNGNKPSSDYKFGIYTIIPSSTIHSHLLNWLENIENNHPSIYSGTWKLVDDADEALLEVHDLNTIKIDDPHNLLRKPVLPVDKFDGLYISQREAFFYVMGWLTASSFEIQKSQNVNSLDMLSLLTNNLISGIFTETEEIYLSELFPLLLTDIGILKTYDTIDVEEIIAFVQIVASLIDKRVNESDEIITKSKFWCTLNNKEQNKLLEIEIGRLLLAKINYCLLNPNSYSKWPEMRKDFKEYHVWEVITQLELNNLKINSIEVISCIFYLDNNANLTNNILYNYLAHLLNLESKIVDFDPNETRLSPFYKLLLNISPILTNMTFVSSWNWNDLGILLSIYNSLNADQRPIMKLLVLRKCNEYSMMKGINIIFDYQLIKEYLSLDITHFPPNSIINILNWNLNNGDLSNSVEIINYLLDKKFVFNLDLISLCILTLTFTMDFDLSTQLYDENKEMLARRVLARKFENNLKISNYFIHILGAHYGEDQNEDQSLFENASKLIKTKISEYQISILQILYDYFLKVSNNKNKKSKDNRLITRKLLIELLSTTESVTEGSIDYKDLLMNIVELNSEFQQDDLYLYTYMICTSYLLSIQRGGNSYIRDNLRSSRRELENQLEVLDVTSYGAFAKLMLVVVKNTDDTRDAKILLKKSFPKLLQKIDLLAERTNKDPITLNQFFRFLFIRYLIRSNTVNL